MKRPGMTYRVHDFKYLTIGIDPAAHSGAYYPVAFAYVRWPVRTTRLHLTLPHLSFAWALRLNRIGLGRPAFWLYRVVAEFYSRIGG